MDILIITVALTATFIGAHLCYERFSRRGRLSRALSRARMFSIAEAPDGELAKIIGRIRFADLEPLSAPATNRRCAYYEIEVEEHKQTQPLTRATWGTVLEYSDHLERFIVEDDTGQALVEAGSPKVVLTMDRHLNSGVSKDPPLELRSFLMVHGVSTEGMLFNKDMRYTEGVLEEGELVAVLGCCHREPDPTAGGSGAGYREAPQRLRIVAPRSPDMPVMLSDDPELLK